MARIAHATFGGHCADAECDRFGVVARDGQPTPMLRGSLVWALDGRGQPPADAAAFARGFERVYKSRHGKVIDLAISRVPICRGLDMTDLVN